MDNYRKLNSGHTDRANTRDPYNGDQKNNNSSSGYKNDSKTDRVVSDTRHRVNEVIKK